jgi:hypothetical protein
MRDAVIKYASDPKVDPTQCAVSVTSITHFNSSTGQCRNPTRPRIRSRCEVPRLVQILTGPSAKANWRSRDKSDHNPGRVSAAFIGHLRRRFCSFGLLSGSRFSLLLPLSILRRHGLCSGRAVHRLGRRVLLGRGRAGSHRWILVARRGPRTRIFSTRVVARTSIRRANAQQGSGASSKNESSVEHISLLGLLGEDVTANQIARHKFRKEKWDHAR